MSGDSSPRWQRLGPDQRREQILAAARRLFRDRHFAAVSTSDIAQAAGVTRGLVHHYFGTKRELFLEVVRDLVRVPVPRLEEFSALTGTLEERVSEGADRWLDVIWRNRQTWLAAIGALGFGRDPEVERIIDAASEEFADRMIEVLGLPVAGEVRDEFRAVIHTMEGMAEAATREWLVRERLTRRQVHRLLADTVLVMVRDVLPRVVAAGDPVVSTE